VVRIVFGAFRPTESQGLHALRERGYIKARIYGVKKNSRREMLHSAVATFAEKVGVVRICFRGIQAD
jgi:hypothetical protein